MLRDIYVEETMFGYKPLTEREAMDILAKGGHVDLQIQNSGSNGTWTVHLIAWTVINSISDKLMMRKINDYLDYVYSITGIDQA